MTAVVTHVFSSLELKAGSWLSGSIPKGTRLPVARTGPLMDSRQLRPPEVIMVTVTWLEF
jgi:hypothetical protein